MASPAGFTQAVVVTIIWCFAIEHGLDPHGFWFLFAATLVSFITQFTIAFQNEQAKKTLDQTLRNQSDTMKLLLVLVGELQGEQEDILEALGVVGHSQASPLDEEKLEGV